MIKILRLFLLITTFAIISTTTEAAVTTYNDRSVYNSAASGLGTPIMIDFQRKDNGDYITNPGADRYFNPLTLRGVSFEGQSYYNDTLYEFPGGITTADLPGNTYAFGLDMYRFYGSSGAFTVTLSTGQSFTFATTPSNGQFFGATSDLPIKWAKFSFNNDYFVIDNFVYGANTPIAPPPAPPLLSGVVSHWPGEGNTNDVVGPNNGTFQNGSGYASGVVGQAFSLDGVSRFITAPDSPSLSLTEEFTLEARVYLTATNRQQAIIEKYDAPGRNGYLLRLHPDGRLASTMCDPSGCDIAAIGGTVLAPNTWYHVAAVYNGGSIRIYINGILDGLIVTNRTLTDGNANLKIGARGDDGNTRFGGLIDEARIHNRALNADEVASLVPPPPIDSTPPVIVPTVTGTLGNNGWYINDVDIIWSVTDPETSPSASGCSASSVATDTVGITFTCSATSIGGTSTESVTIKRDAIAPVVSCGSADLVWHSADVSLACNNQDATSGLAVSGDASFSLSTSVLAGTETANAATGSRQVCDNAGNCSTAGPVGGNKVDKKAPVITITAPVAGNYLLNQTVTVGYSCSDGGSGVANCTGTAANGGMLDTASPEAKTFTVSSADNVGNAAIPIVVNYTVNFGVIALHDQTKAHKSGSTVPIKIRLVDANGANVSAASTVVHAISVIQISSQASTNFDDAGNSNPDFDFRYDADLGGYIFNLKTTGYGTGSYLLNFVAGNRPPIHSVGFQVRQ
jgi:Concanavalin A-like lectin/glucanases superfamily